MTEYFPRLFWSVENLLLLIYLF